MSGAADGEMEGETKIRVLSKFGTINFSMSLLPSQENKECNIVHEKIFGHRHPNKPSPPNQTSMSNHMLSPTIIISLALHEIYNQTNLKIKYNYNHKTVNHRNNKLF